MSKVTEKMIAYGFFNKGKTSRAPSFEKREMDRPTPDGRQLVVEVKAVSINPTDIVTRAMKKEEDDSFTILGRDVSGVVVETGPDAELFQPGDEVFYPGTSNIQGAQAEFHCIDERMVASKPRNVDFAEAAALPLTALTGYEVLLDRLDVFRYEKEPNETNLLIVGAAGGAGSIATQIALNYGFNVIGTASREESVSYLKELGVTHIINHKEDFKEQLNELGIETIDFVYGASNTDRNIEQIAEVIRPQGRVCSIVPLPKALPHKFFAKSITFSYELMYTRSIFEESDWIKQHEHLTELKNQVEQGNIKTTLTHRFSPLNAENLTKAFSQLMTGHTVGKIVLENVEK